MLFRSAHSILILENTTILLSSKKQGEEGKRDGRIAGNSYRNGLHAYILPSQTYTTPNQSLPQVLLSEAHSLDQ